MAQIYDVNQSASVLKVNKVLKNTFMLLGITILFSAFTAYLGILFNIRLPFLVTLIAYFALFFLVHRNANRASGIFYVFALTGFLGLTMAPILSFYLTVNPSVLVTAFAMTGFTFFGLSAYVILSNKRFNFLAGILTSAILVAFLAGLAAMFFNIPALSLAVSAVFVLISCGFILYEVGEIVHSGQTNYIVATVSLYVSIYNLFLSLIHLLGAFSGRE